MTDDEELIEQVARAICKSHKIDCGLPESAAEYEASHEWIDWSVEAQAAIAAMQPRFKAERIRGGEMVKEAAARENLMICLTNCEELTDEAMEALNFATDRIRALSVPAIVEAGEHQPKENTDASSD